MPTLQTEDIGVQCRVTLQGHASRKQRELRSDLPWLKVMAAAHTASLGGWLRLPSTCPNLPAR